MIRWICRILTGLLTGVFFTVSVCAAESSLTQFIGYLPPNDLLLSAAAACAALAMTFSRKP